MAIYGRRHHRAVEREERAAAEYIAAETVMRKGEKASKVISVINLAITCVLLVIIVVHAVMNSIEEKADV